MRQLLNKASAVVTGAPYRCKAGKKVFHVLAATTAGGGSVTIDVEVSLDGVRWGSIFNTPLILTLSTTEVSEIFTLDPPWDYVRANVLAISGTGAYVDLLMGGDV